LFRVTVPPLEARPSQGSEEYIGSLSGLRGPCRCFVLVPVSRDVLGLWTLSSMLMLMDAVDYQLDVGTVRSTNASDTGGRTFYCLCVSRLLRLRANSSSGTAGRKR
jgi:hypothetical protein